MPELDIALQVMLTYFRVLKRRPPPPALFPAVMEGLAKFVHLVNLDTVQDLLDLLRDLLEEVRLCCVLLLRAACFVSREVIPTTVTKPLSPGVGWLVHGTSP